MDDPTKYHAGFRFDSRRKAAKFVRAVGQLEARGDLLVHDHLILHPPRKQFKAADEFHDASPAGTAMLGAVFGFVAGAFIGVAFGIDGSMSNAVGIAAVVGAVVGAFIAWLIARFSGMSTRRVTAIRKDHRAGTSVVFLVSHVVDDAAAAVLSEHPAARPLEVGTDPEVSQFIEAHKAPAL